MGKKLALKSLGEFRRQLNDKEANAVTDRDADRKRELEAALVVFGKGGVEREAVEEVAVTL